MTSFSIDDKTLMVYESRQLLIESVAKHLRDLHRIHLHNENIVFWIDEDEILLDIVRTYALSYVNIRIEVFMNGDATEYSSIEKDAAHPIDICYGNYVEDTNIDVFLLSSNILTRKPPVDTKLLNNYLKTLQSTPEQVLTIFSGEQHEASCYQVVVTKRYDQLEIEKYPKTLYCDIYACGRIKHLISQHVLMSQTINRDKVILSKSYISNHNNYHYRIVLANSTEKSCKIKVPDVIKKDVYAQIASHVCTVTGAGQSPFTGSRVLLFSPHPDDDVISAGLGLLHLSHQDVVLHVAYCVTGYTSVRDEYLKHVPENLIDLRAEKTKVREDEAKCALELIGVPEKHIHFLRLPFYDNNHSCRRRVYDQSDVQIVIDIIEKIKPNHIFLAGDLADPHQTHEVCYTIIKDALEAVNPKLYQQLRNGMLVPLLLEHIRNKGNCPELSIDDIQSAIHGPMNFIQCQAIQSYNVVHAVRDAVNAVLQFDVPIIWLYRGSWNRFTIGESSLILCGTHEDVNKKECAIRAHVSQMGKAMFMGEDSRSFDIRAHDLCTSTAAQLSNLTTTTAYGVECYVCSLILL